MVAEKRRDRSICKELTHQAAEEHITELVTNLKLKEVWNESFEKYVYNLKREDNSIW